MQNVLTSPQWVEGRYSERAKKNRVTVDQRPTPPPATTFGSLTAYIRGPSIRDAEHRHTRHVDTRRNSVEMPSHLAPGSGLNSSSFTVVSPPTIVEANLAVLFAELEGKDSNQQVCNSRGVTRPSSCSHPR